MKLLLDENLSRRLVPFLQHAFPGTSHVVLLGLQSADDLQVWNLAKVQGFSIVTLDADFQEMSLVLGQPPKVIRLRSRNPSRAAVLKLLIDQSDLISEVLIGKDLASIEIFG